MFWTFLCWFCTPGNVRCFLSCWTWKDLRGKKSSWSCLRISFFLLSDLWISLVWFALLLFSNYFEQETPLTLHLGSHVPVVLDLISSHMQEQFFKQKTEQPWICYITDIYSLEHFYFSSFTVSFNWPLEQPQTHGLIYSLIKAAFSEWCLPWWLWRPELFQRHHMVVHFPVSSVPTPARSWLRAGFTNLFFAASSCSVGSSLTQW